MTCVSLSRIVEISDNMFSFSHAEKWDNCGIQIGDPSAIISSIAFALDPTPKTIHFASENLCNLLITHHPLLLESVKTIRADDFTGRTLLDAARLGVAILSLHTNFDAAEGGINDELAERIGLLNISTPENAICARFGSLPEQTTVYDLTQKLAYKLQIPILRMICEKDKPVQTLFIASGSGMGYFQCAMELGVDVIVTGDVRYHAARAALEMGMAVIDAGHFGLEKRAPTMLAKAFRKEFKRLGLEIHCTEYEGEIEPYQYISSASGGFSIERSVGAFGQITGD
jgi:dinuclear metal center YbgI/SA1388 family protein